MFTFYALSETKPPMSEERFIAIEIKVLHQDRLLEELHEVIYKQQEIIDRLQKKMQQIEDMANADNEIRPANEKPPHY